MEGYDPGNYANFILMYCGGKCADRCTTSNGYVDMVLANQMNALARNPLPYEAHGRAYVGHFLHGLCILYYEVEIFNAHMTSLK